MENKSAKKKIVILGGGYAGLRFLCTLEQIRGIHDLVEITLVDKKQYFECNLASVNFLVDPQKFNGLTKEYTKYLKQATFICGDIDLVTPSHVTITLVSPSPSSSSSSMPSSSIIVAYDILVVCMGTYYPLFKPDLVTIAERREEVFSYSQKIRDAERIIIVGGRGVGVEMVGSVVEEYPEKEVIFVHSKNDIMDIWPRSGIDKLRKFLDAQPNLTLKLNCRVVKSEGNMHELSDGTVIEAELKIMTCGAIPNTRAFQTHFSNAITPLGYLKVNENLQLEGYDRIFAFGDVAEVPMNRTAILVKVQVKHVISCVTRILYGKSAYPLKLSFSFDYPFYITLGNRYGMMALPLFGGLCYGTTWFAGRVDSAFRGIVNYPHK